MIVNRALKNAGTCVTQHLFKQHKEIIALWLLGETRWERLFGWHSQRRVETPFWGLSLYVSPSY
jgi:hypothetical protein